MGGGGHVKFYPYEKGGGGKSFSHAERGGHNIFWGSFYAVLAMLKGGAKSFHSFKGGRKKFYPVSRGRLQKVSHPPFSHF